MHLLGAWTRPRGTALFWHIHDYVGPRRLMRRLLWPFRRACSVAIANSKSVAEDLARVLPGVRIVPIYNAIDLQRFSPAGDRMDLDAKAGLAPAPPGTVRVGFIGTYAHWKGHKVFSGRARRACLRTRRFADMLSAVPFTRPSAANGRRSSWSRRLSAWG